jgi:predicted negative regulator of RcsB-dependent stress response
MMTERTAAITTAVSGTSAVISWISNALIIVQIIASVVAIVAGIASWRYYNKKRKDLDDRGP